jgi:CRISPR/Cas system-associated protein Csx1
MAGFFAQTTASSCKYRIIKLVLREKRQFFRRKWAKNVIITSTSSIGSFSRKMFAFISIKASKCSPYFYKFK